MKRLSFLKIDFHGYKNGFSDLKGAGWGKWESNWE